MLISCGLFVSVYLAVKGLWDKSPIDWPNDVPYLDPNNAQKSKGENCKPKKETLMKMFSYLQHKYTVSIILNRFKY